MGAFTGLRFDRITRENIEKSKRKAATERYKADIGAAAKVATARMAYPPSRPGGETSWGPAAGAGEMERAELTAAVKREELAAGVASAAETARLRERELGLGEEAFEFKKAFLKKKKKKGDVSAVEEIESIVASPRY